MTFSQKSQIIEAAAKKRAELDRQRWSSDVPPWDEMTETMRRFRLDDAALYAEAFGVWDYIEAMREVEKRLREETKAICALINEHGDEKAKHEWKWAIYGSAVYLQVIAGTDAKGEVPCATASK